MTNGAEAPLTVRVQLNSRGHWTVSLPAQPGAITCETLEDARRVAYLSVAHGRTCELIVHDAYHRVLDYELISSSWA